MSKKNDSLIDSDDLRIRISNVDSFCLKRYGFVFLGERDANYLQISRLLRQCPDLWIR